MYPLEQLREAAERVLSLAQADQAEVVIEAGTSNLTRFANSTIHQNTSEQQALVSVRFVLGKKVGCARANSLEPHALDHLARRAREIALLQPDNPDFVSLPEPQPAPPVTAFDQEVAECSPTQRAHIAKTIIQAANQRGLKAFGSVSTGASTLLVANSLGINAHHPFSEASLTALISNESSSGWAEDRSWQLAALDPRQAAQTAAEKCLQGENPVELEPGDYPVVLEEPAVNDLLSFLAYVGFGATAFQEGTSFMSESIGHKVADEKITLWDDALDPRGVPLPFDYEGVPKQKVTLLDAGVAKGVVYDSYTANRERKKSTGHAFLAPNPHGPFPSHLFLAPGNATKQDMIASIQRGLLVTRFHYTNVVHPKLTIITGMTRDGTFLIESGKLTRGIKNLRFTQSILEALESVSLVGSICRLGDHSFAPPLKISSFHFSGRTEF